MVLRREDLPVEHLAVVRCVHAEASVKARSVCNHGRPGPAGERAVTLSTDIFAKVRGHEREELLRAARDADLVPYFRLVESPALPEVEMEGRPRIMLASNNYLGLTADERVVAGARERARALRHGPDRVAPA